MTNEERDTCIQETHDAIVRIEPMVKAHDQSLYGNGQRGVCERVIAIEQREETCSAKIATPDHETRLRTLEGRPMRSVAAGAGIGGGAIFAIARLIEYFLGG